MNYDRDNWNNYYYEYMKMRNVIYQHKHKLQDFHLYQNINAINYIKPNIRTNHMFFEYLCANINAIELIEKYIDLERTNNTINVEYFNLFKNKNAIHLIDKCMKYEFKKEIYYQFEANIIRALDNKIFTLSENQNALHYFTEQDLSQFYTHYHIIYNGYPWENILKHTNKEAIAFMEKHIDKLPYCGELFYNKKAIHIIEKKLDLLFNNPELVPDNIKQTYNPYNLNWLGANKNATKLLIKYNHLHKYWKTSIYYNPNALDLCDLDYDKIYWTDFVMNTATKALKIIETYLHALKDDELCKWCNKYLSNLCRNEYAIQIIEKHIDIERLYEKCWINLCSNKNAIDFIEKNIEQLSENCWFWLSKNPAIFEYSYTLIPQIKKNLNESILATVLHPENYEKFKNWGFLD
jgi:hypothetical protein